MGSYWWGHTGIVGHMGSSSRSYTAGLVIILVGHSTVGQAPSMAGCVEHGPYQGCAADQAVHCKNEIVILTKRCVRWVSLNTFCVKLAQKICPSSKKMKLIKPSQQMLC